MGGCFVPGCDSGQRGSLNNHLFRPSPSIFPEWKRILNKIRSDTVFNYSNKNHRVCSIHFEEKWILKAFVHNVNGTTVRIPRDRWKLDENAVPTIFPSLPKHLNAKKQVQRRPLIRLQRTNTGPPSKLKVELKTQVSVPPSPLNLMKHMFTNWMNTHLPNNWKINETDDSISFYTLVEGDQNLQIDQIVAARLCKGFPTWSFLIRGTDVSQLVGFSGNSDDFVNAMSRFVNLRVCEGVKGFPLELRCKTGIRQDGIWRSKDCETIGTVRLCLPCKKLHATLGKQLLKSPKPKKLCKSVISNGKYYKAKAKKLSLECRTLRKELILIKKSLREIDSDYIKTKLQEINISLTTQSAILHALQAAQVKSSKGMRYSCDWLLECVLLKMKSPACYKHLRESKLLPLPHPSTLLKLISGQKCEFGFNKTSIAAIKTYFSGKQSRDCQGILMFDEVQLRETLEYKV